jgi:hypothetical protein
MPVRRLVTETEVRVRALRPVTLLVLLSLVAGACGDDDGAGSTEPPATTTPAAPTTTLPPATTTTMPPATTTTTPPTTTTLAPTTTATLPPGTHPALLTTWEEFLPGPGARATYRVDLLVSETPMNHDLGIAGDFEARMEYGAGRFGQDRTFHRFVFGLETAADPGLALFFDLDEPWIVRFYALTVWPAGDQGRGPEISIEFDEPLVFDISGQPGASGDDVVGFVRAIGPWGVDDLPANVGYELREGAAEPVTVGAGTFEHPVVYDVWVYGPIVGGPDYPIEFALDPEQLILRVVLPGASVELLEPWG